MDNDQGLATDHFKVDSAHSEVGDDNFKVDGGSVNVDGDYFEVDGNHREVIIFKWTVATETVTIFKWLMASIK